MHDYYSGEIEFNNKLIDLKKEKVLQILDVPENIEDQYVNEMIDGFIQKTIEICNPRASYMLFENPVFIGKNEMLIKNYLFSLNKIVLSALKESSNIAIFIATAGDSVENLSKQYIQKGHFLEGLILDVIGSEIAEWTAELIHKRIEHDMLIRGFNITNRYSPGYCNWPVSDQQNLFALLNGNTCEVKLTKSSLMIPIKSVSGIIGAGENVKNIGYSCARCDVNACIYRDKR